MEFNFNSIEIIPNLKALAAFHVDSGKVFKEDVDTVPVISSWHLRRLGRNRLQEESAMLPLKNKPNILELA